MPYRLSPVPDLFACAGRPVLAECRARPLSNTPEAGNAFSGTGAIRPLVRTLELQGNDEESDCPIPLQFTSANFSFSLVLLLVV